METKWKFDNWFYMIFEDFGIIVQRLLCLCTAVDVFVQICCFPFTYVGIFVHRLLYLYKCWYLYNTLYLCTDVAILYIYSCWYFCTGVAIFLQLLCLNRCCYLCKYVANFVQIFDNCTDVVIFVKLILTLYKCC